MAWQKILQFRLSTILLLTTLCAVSLAWYVDHYSYLRNEIVGEWVYPTNDINLLGYSTRLVINRDGTFTKRQSYRSHTETFSGTYAFRKDGQVVFHVREKVLDSYQLVHSTIQELQGELVFAEPKVTRVDEPYVFRCAIDRTGHLVMGDLSFHSKDDDIGIHWETYMPAVVEKATLPATGKPTLQDASPE